MGLVKSWPWAATLLLILLLKSYAVTHDSQVDIDQAADVVIYGANSSDKAGWAFTTGDYDGDGTIDLAILSPGATPPGRSGAGITTILWGSSVLDSIVDLQSAANISTILGVAGNNGLAGSLSSGDINNDDIDDIIIGTALRVGGDKGTAHVVFGTTNFPDTVDLDNPAIAVTKLDDQSISDGELGWASCSGDVNGDGYDDLVVSAPNYMWTAEVYVIYGADSLPPLISVNTPSDIGLRIIGVDVQEGFGKAVACGDVNDDGYDDLLIGSPGAHVFTEGRVHLFYGSDVLPDTIRSDDPPDGSIAILPEPEFVESHLGQRLTISDVNGDEFGDMIITAPGANPLGCLACGEVYVICGSGSLPDTVEVGDPSLPITRLLGSGDSGGYGNNVVSGDITEDGYDDLIIRRNTEYVPSEDQDEVIVFYGSESVNDSVFLATDTTVTRIFGRLDDDEFGIGLGCGDVNNDGVDDMIIGNYDADPPGRTRAGKAYVVYGIDSSVTATTDVFSPRFDLRHNYPNPFSSQTTIHFDIPQASDVTIAIYDVLGRRIRTIVHPRMTAGENTVVWDGRDENGRRISSGVYFYRVEAAGLSRTRKLVLTR